MNLFLILGPDLSGITDLFADVIYTVAQVALTAVFLWLLIDAVKLGIKTKNANNEEKRASVKKEITWHAIGILLMILLLITSFLIREPLVNWLNEWTGKSWTSKVFEYCV